jgi:hypothetical protein
VRAEPDVLAHGQIVTTDLAVALFVFLSVIAFQSVTDRVTSSRVLLAGLATGAALASKFSALVLVPILITLAAVAALSSRPLSVARRRGAPRALTGTASRLAVLALVLLAIGTIALAFVWATYAFQPRLANDPEAAASLSGSRLERPGAVTAILRAIHALGSCPTRTSTESRSSSATRKGAPPSSSGASRSRAGGTTSPPRSC